MKEIVIDKKVRFGKPVIKGTRVTVDEVIGAMAAGMTYEEIEKEYGIKRDGVAAALRYATELISEEVDSKRNSFLTPCWASRDRLI